MADIEWQPLPTLWPSPAIWTDVGECMLLVFTQDGLPIMGSPSQSKLGGSSADLKASLAERVSAITKSTPVHRNAGSRRITGFSTAQNPHRSMHV